MTPRDAMDVEVEVLKRCVEKHDADIGSIKESIGVLKLEVVKGFGEVQTSLELIKSTLRPPPRNGLLSKIVMGVLALAAAALAAVTNMFLR